MSRKRLMAVLTGVPELDNRLKMLAGPGIDRVSRAAVRAAINVVARTQQALAPQGHVRGALGSRMLRKREGFGAKAGGGVGKQVNQLARTGRRGVGISARNIHWWLIGTAERETGSKRVGKNSHKRGVRAPRQLTGGARHPTGRMPAHGIIRQAAQLSAGPAHSALVAAVSRGIEREWRKAGQ